MTTATLSLYEDNAGGLSLLRHSDNAVIFGLEYLYANGDDMQGTILDADETEYWLNLNLDTEYAPKVDEWYYKHSDGHMFRFEQDGENAECFDDNGVNAINLVAQYDDAWTTYPEKMGTNASLAITGQRDALAA